MTVAYMSQLSINQSINQFIRQQRAKSHVKVAIYYTIIVVQDNVYNL